MKPFFTSNVPFKVYTALIIILFSISSCQLEADKFIDEEIEKNSTNSDNSGFSEETNTSETAVNDDNCNNIGFVMNGNVDNTSVYPRLQKLNLDRPDNRDGLYSLAIHQLKRFSGSDLMQISSYNGNAAITFAKDTGIEEIAYFGYKLFEMPNLSNSSLPSLASNNSLLPNGIYNILQEIDINDSEFMLVIDAPFYSVGTFSNQASWAISLISDQLLTVHDITKPITQSDPSNSFDFQFDESIYQSEIDFIQVNLELDCGITTKIYDRNFNQI